MTLKKCRLTAVATLMIVLTFCFLFPQKSFAANPTGPVALDAGHGGADSGAVANGLVEKELTWKVANYCKQRLDQLGIPNIMVRTSPDENPSILERCQRANNAGARCLISFHFNSGGASANGAELLVGNESPYNYWTTQEGKHLANVLLPWFANLGIGNRGIVQRDYPDGEAVYPDGSIADYYGITRYARYYGMTGNIIEHGFLTNTHDATLFKDEGIIATLGNWDAESIAAVWPQKAASNWVYDGTGWKYQYSDGTFAVNTWLKIDGKIYNVDEQGYRRSAWYVDGSGYRYYFDPATGAAAVSIINISGKDYNFNADGILIGWFTDAQGNTTFRHPDTLQLCSGLCNLWGSYYYFDPATCYAQTGWQQLNGYTYYFYPNSFNAAAGGVRSIQGKDYNFRSDGILIGWFTDAQGNTTFRHPDTLQLCSGLCNLWGSYYYFDPATCYAQTGWQQLNGYTYYFYPNSFNAAAGGVRSIQGKEYNFRSDGILIGWFTDAQGNTTFRHPDTLQLCSGLCNLWGSYYYFDPATCYAQTGWQQLNGYTYYFYPNSFNAATGSVIIDGQRYTFDSQGHLMKNVSTWTDANGNPSIQTQPSTKVHWYDATGSLAWTRTTNTPAMSASAMTKEAFIASFSSRLAANYPSIYVSNPAYGATTPQAFAEATWNAANSEGVRPEFLAAQIADETGWLKFGGAVPASACNFGGIGAVDSSPQSYAIFPNIQTGLLAQAQHIKAYSSTAALNNPCVDPRFHLVTRGIAPYIEDYGWGMWASNPTYNIDLLRIMNTILAG